MNEKINKKFILDYSKDTLPCFVEWNSDASHDYALGIEASTALLDDGFEYRQIKVNEEIDFKLTMTIK